MDGVGEIGAEPSAAQPAKVADRASRPVVAALISGVSHSGLGAWAARRHRLSRPENIRSQSILRRSLRPMTTRRSGRLIATSGTFDRLMSVSVSSETGSNGGQPLLSRLSAA